MWNFVSIHCFPIFETALLFAKFPYFPHLSFWQEKSVDENEYGALVGRYRQGKTYV
jgi:hypothetical protein